MAVRNMWIQKLELYYDQVEPLCLDNNFGRWKTTEVRSKHTNWFVSAVNVTASQIQTIVGTSPNDIHSGMCTDLVANGWVEDPCDSMFKVSSFSTNASPDHDAESAGFFTGPMLLAICTMAAVGVAGLLVLAYLGFVKLKHRHYKSLNSTTPKDGSDFGHFSWSSALSTDTDSSGFTTTTDSSLASSRINRLLRGAVSSGCSTTTDSMGSTRSKWSSFDSSSSAGMTLPTVGVSRPASVAPSAFSELSRPPSVLSERDKEIQSVLETNGFKCPDFISIDEEAASYNGSASSRSQSERRKKKEGGSGTRWL